MKHETTHRVSDTFFNQDDGVTIAISWDDDADSSLHISVEYDTLVDENRRPLRSTIIIPAGGASVLRSLLGVAP